MKFNIAAAALVLQALPTASTLDSNLKQVLTNGAKFWDEKKGLLSAAAAGGSNGKLAQRRKNRRGLGMKIGGKRSGPLLNRKGRKTKGVSECDPNALDMGILECGAGNYCSESRASSKGGICASNSDRRKLQACGVTTFCTEEGTFCNLDFGAEGECEACPCGDPITDCGLLGLYNPAGVPACVASCTQSPADAYTCQDVDGGESYFCESTVDPDTGYGTEVCYGISDYCDEEGAGCCYGYGYSVTYGANNYTSVSIIYNFYTPYSQNVTLTYDSNYECDITFNGEACNSCVVVGDGEDPCVEFDCTNNPPGMMGSSCNGTGAVELIPVLAYCGLYDRCDICDGGDLNGNLTIGVYSCDDLASISYLIPPDSDECDYAQDNFGLVCCGEGTPCNICSGGGSLLNPYVELVENVTCGDLYYAGQLGLIPEESCAYYASLAGPTCCNENVGELCILCPGDGDVENPDQIIQTPGQPEVTCGQLQEFGRTGAVPGDLCAAAQIAVPALCGCLDPDSSMVPGETPPPGSMDPSMAPGSMDPSMMPGSMDPSMVPGETPAPGSMDPSMVPGETPAPGSMDPSMVPGETPPPGSMDPSMVPGETPAPGSMDPSTAPEPTSDAPSESPGDTPVTDPPVPSPTDPPAPPATDPPAAEPTDPPAETDPPSGSFFVKSTISLIGIVLATYMVA